MKRSYHIKTFGCQMNEHDSLKMSLLLEEMGYVRADGPGKADLILFNTCTVREKAHHKAMSEAGRALLIKKENPGAIVGVCGCVAQQEGAVLIDKFRHIDFVVGPDEISRLPEIVRMAEARLSDPEEPANVATRLINKTDEYRFVSHTPGSKEETGVTAFVTIMKGCNNACSFCIVPSVRGREVSRSSEEIINEINSLSSVGVREVVLLGQNVNSYGRGLVESIDFPQLVRRIAAETEIARIRFTSPHPKDLSDALIREYSENPKLMPHMHLPVQSGSDRILKMMNRCYTRAAYMERVALLREASPFVSVTTDIIVGFPTESDADFEETLDLMRTIRFDGMFAFKYSPRPGTLAAKKYEDDVLTVTKEERLDKVLSLNQEITTENYRKFVGTTQEVLVERQSRRGKGQLTGRIPSNIVVNFAGDLSQVGSILPLKINKANRNSLHGELIK